MIARLKAAFWRWWRRNILSDDPAYNAHMDRIHRESERVDR